MNNQVTMNKFQKSIVKRANTLSKYGFEPRMTLAGNKFVAISIPVIRDGRKALHFMEYTKTSKTTVTAKCYYEFSDDKSEMVAPIPVDYKGQLHQIGNAKGIYKLNF
jgi:hypothetical protein